jgi:hypothetical protein
MHDMADGTDIQVPPHARTVVPLVARGARRSSCEDHERSHRQMIVAPRQVSCTGWPMQDVELATKRPDDIQKQGPHVEIGTHIDGVPLGDPLTVLRARRRAWSSRLCPSVVLRVSSASADPGSLQRRRYFRSRQRWRRLAIGRSRARDFAQCLVELRGGAFPWIAPRIEFVWQMAAPWSKAIAQAPSETLKRSLVRHNRLLPAAPASWPIKWNRPPCRRPTIPSVIRQPAPGSFGGPRLALFHSIAECRGSAGNRSIRQQERELMGSRHARRREHLRRRRSCRRRGSGRQTFHRFAKRGVSVWLSNGTSHMPAETQRWSAATHEPWNFIVVWIGGLNSQAPRAVFETS